MKKSIIAATIASVLGFLSMGALGALLAYAAWPVVYRLAGNPNDWRGDDVWSAMIWAGFLWGAGFLAAGFVNRHLEQQGWSQIMRRSLYVLVLWGSAALIWALMILTLEFQ